MSRSCLLEGESRHEVPGRTVGLAFRSSVAPPDCSAAMYAAYHAGHSSSRWPLLFLVLCMSRFSTAKRAR